MNFLKKHILTTILLITIIAFQTTIAKATSDFNISSSHNIYLEKIDDVFTTVEVTLKIEARNPNYYIPANSEYSVIAPKEDLVQQTTKVKDNYGRNLDFDIQDIGENFKITFTTPENITTSRGLTVTISYSSQDSVKQNGNITNLYLIGLHKDTVFEEIDEKHNLKTTYTYNLEYKIPSEAPEPSLIYPDSITQKTEKGHTIFSFSQEDRLGRSGWIQLGDTQYYKFKITQEIPQTDFLTPEKLNQYTNWVSKNIVEIALPKEFSENSQEVFFEKIHPRPKSIKTDAEGNVFGVFEIDANRNQVITIEGYIRLKQNEKNIPDFKLNIYENRLKELQRLNIYTQPDNYWESDNVEIQEVAKKLKDENNTVLELIRANYKFVVDKLEYSKEKANQENIRHGALAALLGAESVCMEYADLMTAILRAQGIPARAAFGYGNDPLLDPKDEQIGHQWVQVWIPDYGWLSIDPTWGETGREYIGSSLDHILWYTVGSSSEQVYETKIFSADFSTENTLTRHSITTTAINKNEVPELDTLETISNIILEFQEKEDIPEIEYILKTTILGRAIILVMPVLITILVITTVSMLISKLFKRKKTPTI